MQKVAQLPVYDPGNAPEIMGMTFGKIEMVGPMMSFQICVPREVGGERVRYVTGYVLMPKESIPANIAMTELALAEEGGLVLVS